MENKFCSQCGTTLDSSSRYCSFCGAKRLGASNARGQNSYPDLAVVLGVIVGIVMFFVSYKLLGESDRVRMPAVGWAIYAIGGAPLLSLVMGVIFGFFTWLFVAKK